MHGSPQRLSALVGEFVESKQLSGVSDVEVYGLEMDSRKIQRGDLFIALAGRQVNGANFIEEAISRGAVAVLAQTESKNKVALSLPVLVLPNLPAVLGKIAANFYHNAVRHLQVTGITGTNGKTTTAFITASLSANLHKSTGLIGTLGCAQISAEEPLVLNPTGYTTPDAITVQQQLAAFADAGCDRVVMEVSSHALSQSRVVGVDFDVAVLTNLSRDHLDYHQSMQEYAAAKSRLFTDSGLRVAIINKDDAFGRELIERLDESVSVCTYSIIDHSADIYANEIKSSLLGIQANIVAGAETAVLNLPMIGEFNLANALAAIAVMMQYGYGLSEVVESCACLPCVPGRMQRVEQRKSSNELAVVIDFAHTPDALEKALSVLRDNCAGKLWCVFGCGGDRDSGKRSQMGEVASRLADYVVLTADNPRSESMQAIIADIESGIDMQNCVCTVQKESDRKKAIAYAIEHGESEDVVLIAGKGHETEQIIGDQHLTFSDYSIASELLSQRAMA